MYREQLISLLAKELYEVYKSDSRKSFLRFIINDMVAKQKSVIVNSPTDFIEYLNEILSDSNTANGVGSTVVCETCARRATEIRTARHTLTDEDVLRVFYYRYKIRYSYEIISEQFRVNKKTVMNIIKRRTYTFIPTNTILHHLGFSEERQLYESYTED